MVKLVTGIECVLFDLDGTLVDTAVDFERVLNTLTAETGHATVSSSRIRNTVSDGARALIKLAYAIEEGDANFAPLLERLLDLYYLQLQHTEALPYPGIDTLLEKLAESGIPWGIVTNKPEKYTLRLLENLNLSKRCAVVICPEQVTHRKPHPEPLLLACEKLDRGTDRTIYIGDHLRDMQAAKNADIIAVAAAYGYLGEDVNIEDWQADFIIKSAGDALALLEILHFA